MSLARFPRLSRARFAPAALAALSAISMTAGCRKEESWSQPAPAPADPGLAPLEVPALSKLPVAGFETGVLSSPTGITRPAPVVVAVLGIGDTPESQCGVWRELVGQRAFVVCPRFTKHYVRVAPENALEGDEAEEPSPETGEVVQSGFRPTELEPVEREIDAAVASLRALLPKYVAPGPIVYAGFSRGAFLGASLVAKRPETFGRAILIEGGQSAWTAATAGAFAKGGGKRVLFVCGQPSCMAEAEPASALLTAARVSTRVVHGQGEGHGYRRQVKEQLRQSLEWVTEGEPAWRQLLAQQPTTAATKVAE